MVITITNKINGIKTDGDLRIAYDSCCKCAQIWPPNKNNANIILKDKQLSDNHHVVKTTNKLQIKIKI